MWDCTSTWSIGSQIHSLHFPALLWIARGWPLQVTFLRFCQIAFTWGWAMKAPGKILEDRKVKPKYYFPPSWRPWLQLQLQNPAMVPGSSQWLWKRGSDSGYICSSRWPYTPALLQISGFAKLFITSAFPFVLSETFHNLCNTFLH